jgi:cob(I)alamin adenosyltransferase
MAKQIYTKYGDEGRTGLLYGGRISKADPRAEAYGTIDEAVAALGLAKALVPGDDSSEATSAPHKTSARVREAIDALQRALFTVGAELATDPAERHKLLQHFTPVTPDMTSSLESQIDALSAEIELPRAFIIPGGTPASAALDLARTTLRRAERRAVALADAGLLDSPELLRYLNRASDFLFMLGRLADKA